MLHRAVEDHHEQRKRLVDSRRPEAFRAAITQLATVRAQRLNASDFDLPHGIRAEERQQVLVDDDPVISLGVLTDPRVLHEPMTTVREGHRLLAVDARMALLIELPEAQLREFPRGVARRIAHRFQVALALGIHEVYAPHRSDNLLILSAPQLALDDSESHFLPSPYFANTRSRPSRKYTCAGTRVRALSAFKAVACSGSRYVATGIFFSRS